MSETIQEEVINHLIKQELQLLERIDSVDVLIDLIDDDFIEVGSSAVFYDKAEVVRWLSIDDESKYSGTSFKAHMLSAEMILLTYISSIKDSKTSKQKQAIRSSIWRLEQGRWRMVFHQGTPMR